MAALASEGLLDKEIARRLGISTNTLRTYWKRIRDKTGEQTRTAIAVAWIEATSKRDASPSEWNPFRRWEIDFSNAHAFSIDAASEIATGDDQEATGLRSVHPDDFPGLMAAIARLFTGKQASSNAQYRIIYAGQVFQSYSVMTAWRDADQRIRKLVGYSLDTLDHPISTEVREPGLWIGGLQSDSFYANPEMCRIFGLDPEKDASTALRFRERVVPGDYAHLRQLADQGYELGAALVTCQMGVCLPGQGTKTYRVQALVVREPNGFPLIIGQYDSCAEGIESVSKL